MSNERLNNDIDKNKVKVGRWNRVSVHSIGAFMNWFKVNQQARKQARKQARPSYKTQESSDFCLQSLLLV